MPSRKRGSRLPTRRQRGQAFLLAVVLLVVGISAIVYNLASPGRIDIEKDKVTAAALEQAKAALIGYAVSVNLSSGRPGDLPCPDTNDSGFTGSSCGNAAGTTGQTSRIGRLPWKSLGLPDLRDGDGERLWYAVSVNFKYNSPSTCTPPTSTTGCLNSDSRGSITVRNNAGTVMNDGSNPNQYTPSGVIAVIFAPGSVLQRQDTGTTQVRDCTGGTGCGVTGTCNSTATAKCNPINYLDVLSGTEDNAAFTDGSATDGFIQGVIRDASNNIVVNDRLITITYQDLMPLLERRVLREAYNCLTTYAANSNGRYPWAASVSASASGDYASVQDERFGRLPDSFAQTLLGINSLLSIPLTTVVNLVCTVLPAVPGCMSNSWNLAGPPACYLSTGTWWRNWKEQVFYGVATKYQPASTIQILPPAVVVPAPTACDGTLNNYDCLKIDPPSASDNKRFVVIVAGKRLSGVNGGQPRTSTGNKSDPLNYLEGENGNNTGTSNIYEDQSTSTTFNDIMMYQ